MLNIVNDQNFEKEVLTTDAKPVLVDFWATWCYPCKTQRPIVEEIANEIGDKATIAELEVDESPNTAMKYNVLSIPTLMIFKEGKVVWQGVGLHQKQALITELNKHLA